MTTSEENEKIKQLKSMGYVVKIINPRARLFNMKYAVYKDGKIVAVDILGNVVYLG